MRVVKQETFSFLSLFSSSSSVVGLPSVPRFSDQFAAINARGPRGPTFSHTRARELSAARGIGKGGDRPVPPVTDNLTPGLNGLLAHNIGRPRQDTGHYNMEMTGTHRPPSIGHAEPRPRPISVTLIRSATIAMR